MDKNFFLIFIFLYFFIPAYVFGEPSNNLETEDNTPTFKLNVSQEQFLPPAMYGTWSIIATVLKSNAPQGAYAPYTNELWTLTQENNEVMLRNIVSNATATIHVDKVEGNTATFHHIVNAPSKKMKVIETPTITVDKDYMKGTNRQEVIFYNRKGQPKLRYYLEMQIKGSRLTDARVTFKDPFEKPLQLEIAPLQFKDEP